MSISADFSLRNYGFFWWDILSDYSWVNRRVETFSFSDDTHLEVTVSVDIKVDQLRELVREYDGREECAEENNIKVVYVPISAFSKSPELDLDVMDQDGRIVSAADSSVSGKLSCSIFFAELELHGLHRMSKSLRRFIEHIIENEDGESVLEEVAGKIRKYSDANISEIKKYSLRIVDMLQLQKILETKALRNRLHHLSKHRYFVVSVPLDDSEVIFKFRRVIEFIPPAFRGAKQIASYFAFRPLSLPFEAEGIGSASRVHTRIVAPEGTRMVRGNFTKFTRGTWKHAPQIRDKRTITVNESIIVAYTKDLKPGKYGIHVQMIPKLGNFFVPAVLLSLLIALFGFTGFSVSEKITAENGGAAVSLVAMLPTLLVTFLVRGSEHGLLYRMHFWPRAVLLAPTFMLVASAMFVALPSTGMWQPVSLLATGVLGALSASCFSAVIVVNKIRFPNMTLL